MSGHDDPLSPWSRPVDSATRAEIERLIVEHAWLVDHGHADRLHELYCEHGQIFGAGMELIGRAAIAAYGRERAAMDRTARHVCSNIRLAQIDGDHVRGRTIVTLYRSADSPSKTTSVPMAVGDWLDLYERTATGSWLIAERRIEVVFESEAHAAGRRA